MSASATFILLAFAYAAVMIRIGLRRMRSGADEAGYFLAGRALGGFATTATLAATTLGGSATILVIGMVYSRGLPFIWTDIAGGLGLILLGLILARRVRGMGCFSLPEIAGEFYGQGVRRIAAALVVLAEIGFLALLLRGTSGLLGPVLEVPASLDVVIIGGVFVLYTVAGGQWAVVRTDVIQLLVMVIGIGALLLFALTNPGALVNLPPGRTAFPVSEEFPPLSVLSLVIIAGLPHLVGSDIYAKALSARDGAVARRAAFGAGAIKILFGVAVGLIGLAAAGILPPDLPQEEVLGRLLEAVLPGWATAVVILAFIATLMSSADSVLLTAATVLTRDLGGLSGERAVRAGRFAIIGIGAAGVSIAVLFTTMLQAFLFAYTLFSASLVAPILLGFWKDGLKLNRMGAGAAMVGGGMVSITGTLLGWPSDAITITGLATCLILLFTISYAANVIQTGNA